MFREPRRDRLLEALAIGLGARAADRASLARIEHPPMDRGLISGARHDPPKRVDLSDEMPFANATNRRVARHSPNIAPPKGRQRNARAAPRRTRSCLDPSVTGTNNQYVEHQRALASRGMEIKNAGCFT